MRSMKIVIAGVIAVLVLRAFANEVGNYCEELNPYNDMGNDFDEIGE